MERGAGFLFDFVRISISFLLMFCPTFAKASDQRKLTYAGRILKADGTPVNASTQFKLQVTDTLGTCVMWEENITSTVVNGVFDLQLGSGTLLFDGGGSAVIDKVFAQGKAIGCKASTPSVNLIPATSDDRNLAVSFNDGTGWQTLSSQIPIKAVPFAMSASGIAGFPVDLTGLADTYVLKYDAASKTWIPTANGAGAGVSSVTAGTGITLGGTAANPVVNLTTPVSAANGGTGLNTSTAANGQVLIGTGAGLALNTLTAGSGISITNASGSITIAATGGGTVTSVTSAGAPITIGGTASAPTVGITQATTTTAGYLSSTDWNTFNGKLSGVSNSASLANGKVWIGDGTGKAQEITLSQDVTTTNAGVTTVNRIQNVLVNSTAVSGGVFMYDTATSTWKGKAFPACTATQAPYWNSGTDTIQCQTVAPAFASVTGTPTTLSGYGITDAIRNAGSGAGNIISSVQSGNTAGRPAFGTDGRIYIDTQAGAIYRDSGTAWVQVSGAGGGGTVTGVSSANTDIGVSVSSPNPVLTLNSGTGNNQIVKLNGSAQLPAVDGSLLTNLSPANLSAVVPLSKGGTNANLTASNGGVVWSNGTQMQILSGTATAGLPLISGSTATPAWSTINLSSGNIQMPAGGNISNASGAMTVSATTNLTLQSNSGSTTTIGNSVGASSTTVNGGGVGGSITLTPGTLGLGVTGWTSGFVKSNGSGILAPASLASGDVTTALGYTPVNKAGDTMTGALVNNTNSASTALAVTQSGAGSAATFMGGNVGVGTNAPSTPLHVKGDLTLESGAYTNYLSSTSGGVSINKSTTNNILFRADQNGSTVNYVGVTPMSSSFAPRIYADGTDASVGLRISGKAGGEIILQDVSGNVGVGTSFPSAKLEVSSGVANTSGLKFTNFTSTAPTGTGQAVGVDASGNLITIASGGGGNALTSNPLSQFAATTSAQLAGVLSDETGTGAVVFGTSPTIETPTFTTNITTPLIIGGTTTTSALTYKTTTAAGTTGADHIFQVGSNGATEAMRILNSGNVGIGTTAPAAKLEVKGAPAELRVTNSGSSTPGSFVNTSTGSAYFSSNYDSSYNLVNSSYPGWQMGFSQSSDFFTLRRAAPGSGTDVNTDLFVVTGAGKVGVGTTTPSQAVDVTGTVKAVNLMITDTSAVSGNTCTTGSIGKDASGNFYICN